MYGNDNMYPSRKSCLDSYKPNPERPPKKELKPFQLPIKGCGEFRCDATNLDKSFEWRCGTPKYCKLFNNATVLKNPDVSYGSERECLNDHETEEQTRARSPEGHCFLFMPPTARLGMATTAGATTRERWGPQPGAAGTDIRSGR